MGVVNILCLPYSLFFSLLTASVGPVSALTTYTYGGLFGVDIGVDMCVYGFLWGLLIFIHTLFLVF